MAYDPTVPNEANLVRTASGDLALMRGNFVAIAPLVSGTVLSGTEPSAAIRGFYLGDPTNRKRYFIQSDGTDILRIQRNINTEASPSWETVLSIAQGTGAAPEFAYKVTGVDPTASGHLATKSYVDSVSGSQTLSGLTDTDVPSPSSGDYLAWNGTDWAVRNTTLQELTDTTIAGPVSGESLVWNGATWENASGQAGASTLSGLTDTSISAPSATEVLTWDGADWINAPISTTLSGLTDTVVTAPTSGQMLEWDGTDWVNVAAPAGTLSGLTDTSIAAPTSGQHLEWDGTDWANVDMPSGNRVICVLSGAQTQSIPQSTPTTVSGDEAPFNQGGWTVASGTVTVPDEGVTRVDIVGQVSWASDATGTNYDAELFLNGSPVSGLASYIIGARDRRRKSTTADISFQQVAAYDLPVASGDTITLVVSQDGAAGGLNVLGGTGILVREATNGGAGGGGGGSSTLAGLTDVVITSPADGAALVYDDGTSKWIDGTVPAATLSGLTDTNITAPVSGGTLKWDGISDWIDAEPVASGIGLVESFDLAVEAVASGDSFTISLYAFYPYDVITVQGKTSNGTCDLVLKAQGTAITGLSGIVVSGTQTGWDASAANDVAVTETLTFDVADATACSGLLLSIKTERT